MSMYDTVEVVKDSLFKDHICAEEWQVHLKSIGASYRITEDLTFEVQKIGLKDNVENDENDLSPDEIEEYWDETDYTGPLRLHGRRRSIDLVLEDGKIVDYDPTVVTVVG